MTSLLAINPALDRAAIRAALAEQRFVQIEDFLEAPCADALWHNLWSVAVYTSNSSALRETYQQ